MIRNLSQGSSFSSKPCNICGQYHTFKQDVLNKLKNTHIFKFRQIYKEDFLSYSRQNAQKVNNQNINSYRSQKVRQDFSRFKNKKQQIKNVKTNDQVKNQISSEKTVKKNYNKLYAQMVDKTTLKSLNQSDFIKYPKQQKKFKNKCDLDVKKKIKNPNYLQNIQQIYMEEGFNESSALKQINSFVYSQADIINFKKMENLEKNQIIDQEILRTKRSIQEMRNKMITENQYKKQQHIQLKNQRMKNDQNKIILQIPRMQDCQTLCKNISWTSKICGQKELKGQTRTDNQTQTYLLQVCLDNWR